jgi:hypothetical protein
MLFASYKGNPFRFILALPNVVHYWRLQSSKGKMCTTVAVSLSFLLRNFRLFSIIYKPVSSIHHFTNVHIYYLFFNSVDNLRYLLYIPVHALLSVPSVQNYCTPMNLPTWATPNLPAMMIGKRCYSAVAAVWTYLLTPWSRVLLEKLTSKLCR